MNKRTIRLAVMAALVTGVSLGAWAYVLSGAGTGMSVWAMTTAQFPPPVPKAPGPAAWTAGYGLTMTGMWAVMMVAMMLPGALLPLLGRAIGMAHGLRPIVDGHGVAGGLHYLAGALLPWFTFSLAATALQFTLEHLGLLDGRFMWSTHAGLTAALLAAAGFYQFSPVKRRSLAACSSGQPDPAGGGRPEPAGGGALPLGLRHGTNCVVRCGPMMLLLFAGGIMNAVWIAGLAAVSLAEPLDRTGSISRILGAVALAAGAWAGLGSLAR